NAAANQAMTAGASGAAAVPVTTGASNGGAVPGDPSTQGTSAMPPPASAPNPAPNPPGDFEPTMPTIRQGQLGLIDVTDSDPAALALIESWVAGAPIGPADGAGYPDTAASMAEQAAADAALTGSDGDAQGFENGGDMTVASVAAIYSGYDTSPQNGSSQIVVPSSPVQMPSDVMTVPSSQVNTPTDVMSSLDLQPALCGR
ncbi:MAG TPA: hypothetical protein VFC47_09485, partial [Caulobacteraceae bacterium]|nr:hypothetical protein [Caulobacteraceae bacterium]